MAEATPTSTPIRAATRPIRYATPPQITKVLAEKMVIYVDKPDSHQEEFLPAMNISSEVLIFRDTSPLTNTSPRKYRTTTI